MGHICDLVQLACVIIPRTNQNLETRPSWARSQHFEGETLKQCSAL